MNQFFPEDGNENSGEVLSAEEKKLMMDELFSGDEPVEPTYFANKGSASEEEALTFTAQPEGKFLIKITNKPSTFYFDPFDFLFNGSLLDETPPEPEASAIPYTLDVKGKVLPEDEDGISFTAFGKEESVDEVMTEKSLEEEFDYTQMIIDGALPYQIGAQGEGYLQALEDEDWFSVTPEKTGIYEFKFPKMKQNELPMIEVYQLVKEPNMNNMLGAFAEGEEEDEPVDTDESAKDGENDPYLNMIGSNFDYMGMVKENMYTGLKEGETYYIKVAPDYFSGTISFDPYRFDSKLILADPQDSYEDNDTLEDIKDFPTTSVKGNFAMPNDMDAFYYEAKAKQINGVSLQALTVDPKEKSKYPAELYGKFYGFITILEDQNKNRKVDEEEYDSARYIMNIQTSGITTGSFETEIGKNYIILASALFENTVPLSLTPYELKMEKVNDQDEDKDSIVQNNIPTKPLKLTSKSNGLFEAKGYFNAGVPYGDEDWYELKLTEDTVGQISLATGAEIDGVISIYKNGRLVTTSDHYATGDQEVLAINLRKGSYHIKIEDTFNNASLTPYALKVMSGKEIAVEKPFTFKDVNQSNWAYDYINNLYQQDIIKGVSTTSFAPEKSISRAEFAAMLGRAFNIVTTAADTTSPFTDVPDWAAQEVQALYEAGIVKGIGQGLFDSNTEISREYMALMIVRTYEYTTGSSIVVENEKLYNDQSLINPQTMEAVQKLYQTRVMEGRPNNEFAPQGLANRAEAAKVISLLMDKVQ